jgi:hypothetical protein
MYLLLSLQNFLLDAKPIVSQATSMIKELDDDLKDLYAYYGEDPSLTKSEDFFGMLHNFATIFTVSTKLKDLSISTARVWVQRKSMSNSYRHSREHTERSRRLIKGLFVPSSGSRLR